MMPDGRRLPVTTEAAGRLGVSVQTIDRLVVASRELTPFNRRWRLVGRSEERGLVADMPDGAFRGHTAAIVWSPQPPESNMLACQHARRIHLSASKLCSGCR
jgi:hypothetical protein